MPAIRALEPRHIPEAGRLLGRAFVDNPAQLAALAHLSAQRRARVVTALHESFCAAAVAHWTAEGLFEQDRLLGVMLVLSPGAYPPSLRSKLIALRGALGAGPRGWLNYARIDAYMQRLHPPEPCHYLFIIGVDPQQQGRGHGKTLLTALNARADASGLPCYLETERESTLRMYEHAGYRVVTDARIPAVGNLRMWTLRRDPA
jgi:GNAT superfamily N-acetyltransferase